jgi:hypothetical protein
VSAVCRHLLYFEETLDEYFIERIEDIIVKSSLEIDGELEITNHSKMINEIKSYMIRFLI